MKNIYVPSTLNLAERLAYFSIPEPNSGCLLWIGPIGSHGYGEFSYKRTRHLAHRAAYTDAKGNVPPGLFVCHKCDVQLCINPNHLFLGTHLDNMVDMVRKGRQKKSGGLVGKHNHQSKLTVEQVHAIKADPRGYRPVARDYGVSPRAIQLIRSGKTWTHVKLHRERAAA